MRYAVVLLMLLVSSAAFGADRPNVVLIITDDQGYGDIAAHGNPVIETPNLDQLHEESVRFTNFHVDPTCSPTRGALMTGKYSHRARVWHTILGGNHLRDSEQTVADVFKAGGYRTAMFGKWHLGGNYPYRPMDRGFEEWLGQGDGGTGTTADYFTNDRVNDMFWHNGVWERREGWAPDVFYGAAIDYVEQSDPDEPFFVYLSTYVPHSPYPLPAIDWVDKYRDREGVSMAAAYFFASIERIDHNIGLLRQTLEEKGIADDTILIFMTDNGGTAGVNVFNDGMRGKKGSPYDGGHRVPFFIHWPSGELQHGEDVADLTAHLDVLPTLIDLCELPAPEGVDFDGRSFKQQLFEPDALLPPRTLMVELQRTYEPRKWSQAAAMTNQWRLVNGGELYDMTSDPGQATNVAGQHPDVVETLQAEFDAYWEHVTPGDRDRPRPIIGTEFDEETYLHSSDWYLDGTPWNHAHVTSGPAKAGSWVVRIAQDGVYRIELRRWPQEADGPIQGVPVLDKEVDAWQYDRPVEGLIYGGNFKALPIESARLQVAEYDETKRVAEDATNVVFDVPLEAGEHEITGTFIMREGGGDPVGTYYAYVRRVDTSNAAE